MALSRLVSAIRARPGLPLTLAGLGVVLTLIAALDPYRSSMRIVGPGLTLAGLVLARRRSGQVSLRFAVLLTLAVVLAAAAAVPQQIERADFPQYFAYLRSLAFDRDLDFANEWQHWSLPEEAVTPTGHRRIQGSIGPAVFWSPFYALAHIYVRADSAFGSGRWAADGYTGPYARATLAGTLVAAVLASFLLGSVIAARFDPVVAALAVTSAVATSTVLHYVFVQPGMAHGLTYALAAGGVWAADRVDRNPSLRAWALLGSTVGLLALVRPQAAAFGLLLAPLVLRDLSRGRLRVPWLLAAGAAAFVAFLPQMAAWKVIYGHWFTQSRELEVWAQQAGVKQQVLFRMSSWFDPRSLHLWDTLFAGDRGLFSWTPFMLIGVVGLVFAVSRFGYLALGGLLVFAATAWFNGSVATYRAGDSFGARRFDLIVPFVALSFAVILDACRRRPLVVPALVLALGALWNVGFIRLFLRNEFTGAAPLERLAAGQAGQLEDLAEDALDRAFGPPGRAFAYNALVGEYMYFNLAAEGDFDLGDPGLRYLASGWSPAVNRTGPPQYRSALYPRSCLRFPLMVAVDLRAAVTAKRPGRLEEQRLGVSLNGHRQDERPLPSEWSALVFDLPRAHALAGENTLCLEFAAGALKGDEGQRIAAHVKRIVVESKTRSWPSPLWNVRHEGR